MPRKSDKSKQSSSPSVGDNGVDKQQTPAIRRPGLRSSTRLQAQQSRETPVINGKSGKSPVTATKQVNDVYSLKKENLVLWKHPISTTSYFIQEVIYEFGRLFSWFRKHQRVGFLLLFCMICLGIACKLDGTHQKYVSLAQKHLLWCGYWVGLGILSSVGFGTGLHTFLLYLGPHIAAVTLAAHECGSLRFPEPPYPDEIICPENAVKEDVSLWSIISKVRVEAFMWGAGTALGELPPYFMARAARLSGREHEEEFDLEANKGFDGRRLIKTVVEKAGFFGILACASIPNPLFDLAGITCGHFLVPFWTFFGATLIGKAVIKMMLQKTFVIIAFNEHHFERFIEIIKSIPYIGTYMTEPFREFLIKQKQSLHRHAGDHVPKQPSWLAWGFEKFVLLMVTYFIFSIVNSMAQSNLQRLQGPESDNRTKRSKRKSKKSSD
ncbi:Vacuole membrane protein 1 [Halotydeus destructor]|nr:Vacuole membrane protein 1 [Halotydeus destructor]